MKVIKFTIPLLVLFCHSLFSQMTVTPNSVANTLAQTIAGYGVTVSNASISCTSNGAGTFTYTGTHLGLTNGVILTTGNATTATQPQSSFSSTDNGNNVSDPQLTNLESLATHNLCKLEFDFVPICPSISIKYVFASEEYPTFVGAGYNDAFGIFLTGPNPSGPAYSNKNIALLPNGQAVSIDNVNSSSNSSSYVANSSLNYNDIVYGGYTIPITSTASITPCQTYHIKFAIADAGDGAYDSGVFIQYDGLSCTNSPTITPHSTASSCSANTGSASVTVAGSTPTSYSWQPGGQTTSSITGQGPGTYTCVMSFSSACTTFTQSQTVTITSPGTTPTVAVSSNTPCPGGTFSLTSTSNGSSYAWTGPGSFSSASQNPTIAGAGASNSGTYTLVVTGASGCTKTTTLAVSVNAAASPTAASSGTICSGQTLTLTTGSAGAGATYAWAGPNSFTSGAQSPSITNAPAANSGVYTLTVTSAAGCTGTTSVNALVNPTPTVTIGSNSPVCAGATLSLTASGATTYSWSGPGSYISSSQNPSIASASVANSGVYTVTATSAGCSTTGTVNTSVVASPTAAVSSNTPCPGGTFSLTATSNGTGYAWSGPSGYTSGSQNPTITNAGASNSGVYTLTVSNATGCTKTSTLSIATNTAPSPAATSSGTICSGQTLTLSTTSGGTGATYAWAGPNGFTSAVQSPSVTNAPAANSGVYSVTVTSSAGCTGTTSVNALVNPTPTVTVGSNSPVCAGTTLSLTSSGGTTYSWSGPGSYTSSSQNPGIASASVANSGVYTVTATSAGCSKTGTVNTSVVASPTVAVSSNTPCPGGTFSLTATSNGTGYAWSGPSGYTSGSQNPTITNAGASNSGVYTLTVSNATGCSVTSTLNLSVNAASSPTAASSGTICAGQTLTLTTASAGTGGTYQWTGPNGFTSAVQSPSVTNAPVANSGVYSVTVTSSAGCSGTTSVNAQVNASPTVTIGSNSPVCAGTTLSLTASGGTSYAWSGPGGYTSASQNPAITPATVGNSGVYTVTATTSGCTGTNTVSATVNAIPTPTASSNSPICAGSTLSLTAGGGTSYAWSGPNAYTSASQNPSIPSASTTATGIYTVTATTAGCSASVTVNVTVNPSPTLTVGSNSPICAGTTLSLTAGGATTYAWSGPNAFTSVQQNPVIASAGTNAAGVYSVTGSAAGCSSTGTVSVTVNTAVVATINPLPPACMNSNVNLNAPGGATSYSWSGPNSFSSSSQNPVINGVTAASSGVYSLTVTTLGCTSTGTVSLSLTGPVSFSVTPVGSIICKNGSTNMSAAGQGGSGNYAYSWTPAVGVSSPNSPSVTVTPNSTQTYTVTLSDATCPSAPSVTAAATVTVSPLPVITFTTPVASGCEAFCTTFTAQSTPAIQNAAWTFSNGQTATGANPGQICFNTHGNYDVKLVVQDVNGCIDSLNKPGYITVYPKPHADFSWDPLTPTIITNDVNFYDQSTLGNPMQQWSWNFGDFFGTLANDTSNLTNPSHTYQNIGTYTVTLRVVNQYGCRDSVAKAVTVEDDFVFYIPNAFTPGVPDGVNDVFNVKGTGFYPDPFDMYIFDRWGEQIFHTDNVMKGWDGSVKGGSTRAKQDVYVYKIIIKDFKGEKREYVGHVTLL